MLSFRELLSGLLIACLSLWASAASRAESPVASDPVFTALSVDGTTSSGRISQFGPGGDLSLVSLDGIEKVIPLRSLVKLAREGRVFPQTPEASVVLFPGGDRLYRTAIGAANETRLDLQSYTLGHLSVPLESLLGLILSLSTDSESVDSLISQVRKQPRNSEMIWLANGDNLTGGFLGLGDKTIEFQAGDKPVKLDRAGVIAIGFDPGSIVYPAPEGGYIEATLTDGSRLGLSELRVEHGQILAKTRFGAAIKLPIADLAQFHSRTTSVTYLSEREPAGERYVDYVGTPRKFRRDASAEGHMLRLSGQDYEKGIGTQSRTLLAYRLDAGDKRFQSMVGVDDRAGPLGNVVFRVLVDGKERFASPALSARDAPRLIDIDVSGAKTLVLITEFGERGGVRDLADWVEARLVR
jgi:NPCBM/NEW2 domain